MTTSGSTESTGGGRAGNAESTTGELLQALTDDVRSLVQQELRSAQAEMTEKARRASKGAAMLGGAAVLGALATGTSAAVLTRILEKLFGPAMAAVIATALYGGGAALLANAGVEELRRALPLLPEHTVSSLRDDVQAAAATRDTSPGAAG